MMIVAKRAGMCAGMCQAGELSRLPAFLFYIPVHRSNRDRLVRM
ncbi:hypothetical protein X727_27625 [Mesorhizobium sp. L103C119B0]|nr:hypothetical protein X727_27625 [Mesorhizobium sp. L103C119B0]